MKKIFFLLLLFITVSFNSQKPDAYDSGEWFKFRIHYGFVNAGYATLEIQEGLKKESKVCITVKKKLVKVCGRLIKSAWPAWPEGRVLRFWCKYLNSLLDFQYLN